MKVTEFIAQKAGYDPGPVWTGAKISPTQGIDAHSSPKPVAISATLLYPKINRGIVSNFELISN
jgi:hypothetical protein